MGQDPIQSLWIGGRLSAMEQMCISSYLQNGHEFHLYIYKQVHGVPPGTIIKDANEVIAEEDIFVDKFGGYVNLSNLFRYTLLYKKGGWWVDMDTVCLKNFDFDEAYVFSSERSDLLNRYQVNTTFIKSPPNAKFLKDCIDFVQNRGAEHIHWGELGVNLISRMIFRNNLQEYVKPPQFFCPVSPFLIDVMINNRGYALPAGSYAVHWWNELWKQKQLDKDVAYPQGSLYQVLKEKVTGY